MLNSDELKSQLVDMASKNENKVVFFELAKRRRALKETTVEAVYVALLRELSKAEDEIKGELFELESLGVISHQEGETLFNTFRQLKREYENKSANEEVFITKVHVIKLFQDLEDLGIGKYTRSYERNKKRFEWIQLSCIDIGRLALFPDYRIEFEQEPEVIVDMNEMGQCYIEFHKSRKGKHWKKFLESIRDWADNELGYL